MDKPIWILEGMTQTDYAKLPWDRKRALLIKHGFKRETGQTIRTPFSGSHLLDAYFQDQADLKRWRP